MTIDPAGASRPKPPWTLREATPEDLPGILECRKATFVDEDLDKQEPEYWLWEFVDNHAGPARHFVADHDGQIVGYYAVVPQTFLINDVKHAGSIVVDVMTHPRYQRQGMFTRLGAFAIEQCTEDPHFEFTTGYPIRPEVIPGHLKVGWKIRFLIGAWVQVFSTAGILKVKAKPIRRIPGLATLLGFGPTAACRCWGRLCVAGSGDIQVERLDAVDDDRFGAFLARLEAEMPPESVIQERTPQFMRWRYDSNPMRTYMYHAALDGDGNIVGLAISRLSRLLDVDTLIVLDALALNGERGRLRVLRPLFADMRRLALERRAVMIAMMVTQPNPIMPSPWKLGFVPTPYRFSFITRELASQTAIDSDTLTWHLTWGDTDDI